MVVPDEQHGIFINIKITDSTMKLFKLFTLTFLIHANQFPYYQEYH